MANGSGHVAQPDENNHMVYEKEDDDLVHRDDNTSMANESDLVAQPDEHNQMVNEEGDDNQFFSCYF